MCTSMNGRDCKKRPCNQHIKWPTTISILILDNLGMDLFTAVYTTIIEQHREKIIIIAQQCWPKLFTILVLLLCAFVIFIITQFFSIFISVSVLVIYSNLFNLTLQGGCQGNIFLILSIISVYLLYKL